MDAGFFPFEISETFLLEAIDEWGRWRFDFGREKLESANGENVRGYFLEEVMSGLWINLESGNGENVRGYFLEEVMRGLWISQN